jgi:hypothetical protein
LHSGVRHASPAVRGAESPRSIGYTSDREKDRTGPATVIHVNDVRGHAAVLALFNEVIAAG